jgi:hypothetical protein
MATYQNLVDGALRICGALASGASPTSQENTDYLQVLNELLAGWSAKLGPVFSETIESLTWTGGQSSRTIGTSGNFNTARPQQVLAAYYRDSSSIDNPIRLITHQEYQALWDKSEAQDIPLYVAYQPTNSSNQGTLFVWPVPASDWTFRLVSLKPLGAVSALSDTVTLPPGYEEAIRWNLAVVFGPENGAQLSPTVFEKAQDSLFNLIRLNDTGPNEMNHDPMAPGGSEYVDDGRLWIQ